MDWCRWELDAVEKLPDYMKTTFRALYDIVNQTAKIIVIKHGSNPVVYLQKAVRISLIQS